MLKYTIVNTRCPLSVRTYVRRQSARRQSARRR